MNGNDLMLSNFTAMEKNNLTACNELIEPLTYYGLSSDIEVCYISDVHILHHINFFDGNTTNAIRNLASSLYRQDNNDGFSRCKESIKLFLGDISSDPEVTIEFFYRYMLQNKYVKYKYLRDCIQKEKIANEYRPSEKECIRRLSCIDSFILYKETIIKKLKLEVKPYINYNSVIACHGDYLGIKKYIEGNYYKKRNIPEHITNLLLSIAALNDEIVCLRRAERKLEDYLENNFETLLKITDFQIENDFLGYVVLGNHEYIGFPDVDSAVSFYKTNLEPMGYMVLHNQMIETDNAVIYGGTGFAKYNPAHNTNNTICCSKMMHNCEYEKEQTSLFELGYNYAHEVAKITQKCFICASHYPVESCLEKTDCDAIYFNGHTHINTKVKTPNEVIYADNQIGYNEKDFTGIIGFKHVTTGVTKNPYYDLRDGYFLTTAAEYLSFYEYLGEYIGSGKLIRKRCETGKLYVIKLNGYYGFFVTNKSGTSIVNGGKTKTISVNNNIEWIYQNFEIVVQKYISYLTPLRIYQAKISKELKEIGLSGRIHGLIIDISFFYHILINPFDISATLYYSPIFGIVQQYGTFPAEFVFEQLQVISNNNLLSKSIIASDDNAFAIAFFNGIKNEYNTNKIEAVDTNTGAYKLSRDISPLQRLFTNHVLREFDIRLTECNNIELKKRSVSWIGRIYCDKESNKFLIVDDDLSDFVKMISSDGKEIVALTTQIKSSLQGEKYFKAYWATKSITETLCIEKNNIPDLWYEIIRSDLSKKQLLKM